MAAICARVGFAAARGVGDGVRGRAEDVDAPGGVLDDGQYVLSLSAQRDRLEEVAGQDRVGLAA